MPIYGLNALINMSLFKEDNPKGPGSVGLRGEPGLEPGSPLKKWWRLKSEANPSPQYSLFNREIIFENREIKTPFSFKEINLIGHIVNKQAPNITSARN